MQNYKNSDYALNMHNKGIVYRNADGSRTIVTLETYLAENPDKTADDFRALKKISDAICLEEDRAGYNKNRKNVSIHKLEDNRNFREISFEEIFFDGQDKQSAVKAFNALLADGKLTAIQERRFRMWVFEGMTHREIAKLEGVNHRAVGFSINAALSALKKYFQKF